ncbi:MAG TPA: cytochrome P460 family protein, partial [Geobacteraceae bacterium]|nr:cytochrome P460 family protein [Geobacteraceae bacterium]
MKRVLLSGLFLTLSITAVASAAGPPVAPNGIALIEGFRDWQVIAPSYRSDKGQIRVVLGNATAIRAFREGKRPFPDGTIFAKVAWNTAKHPRFPVAVVPAAFAQVEF